MTIGLGAILARLAAMTAAPGAAPLARGRLGLVFGRHLPGVQPIQHHLPLLCVFRNRAHGGVSGQIERGFFLRAIQLLQPREYFRRRHRDQRGSVAENNGQQARFHIRLTEQHQQGKSGDNSGQDQR